MELQQSNKTSIGTWNMWWCYWGDG